MYQEIGSEFWSVPVTNEVNELFPESTQWYLSGRSALTAIIRDIKKKKKVFTVAMPSWCCDSMILPFIREGIDVNFYPVYWQEALIQDIQLNSDVILLMNYFGFTGEMPCLDDYKGIVIRDVTHSILSSSYYNDADYYFGSLRKWCGLKTGGFAWGEKLETGIDDKEFIRLRIQAMHGKEKYIQGDSKEKNYLKFFEKAEKHLDKQTGVYRPFNIDVYKAHRLDITQVREQRRNNASILMDELRQYLIFSSLSIQDCPLFIPIMIPNGRRDRLRNYLIEHRVFCPVHWPVSKYHKLNARELSTYESELSLVCDQRYTGEDMYRIIDTIREFLKDG